MTGKGVFSEVSYQYNTTNRTHYISQRKENPSCEGYKPVTAETAPQRGALRA